MTKEVGARETAAGVHGKTSNEAVCFVFYCTFSLRDDWSDRVWGAQLAYTAGKVRGSEMRLLGKRCQPDPVSEGESSEALSCRLVPSSQH
jgi:hypothetical protein